MCDAGRCQPFCVCPRPLASQIDGNCRSRDVFGLAVFDDLIFVARRQMEKISVYRATGQHEHVEDIDVKSCFLPTCLIASESNGCLFLADKTQSCVWRVQASCHSDELTKKMTERVEKLFSLRKCKTVQSLSAVPNDQSLAVLMSSENESGDSWVSEVHLYKVPNGKPVRHNKTVQVPPNAWCISCNEKTIVVGFGMENQPTENSGVQEIDYNTGQILRTCAESFKVPRSIHRDCETGAVFVADSVNRRILALNKELEVRRVLLAWNREDEQPVSICYHKETGQLFVGFCCGKFERYKICKMLSRSSS